MNNSNPSPRLRALVSIAAFLAAAMATVSLGPVPASAAAAVLPAHRLETVRRALEGDEGHEDHDHGGTAGLFAEGEDDHDDHDHGDEGDDHDDGDDSHAGHDHEGDDHGDDSHAGYDHGDQDDHDDHDGHDHGDDSHAGHDHGDGSRAYEWAGSFALDDERHTWSMQKVDGAYADPSMRVVLIATSNPGEETQEAFADMAEALMEGECAIVEDGGWMAVSVTGECNQLRANDEAADSTFGIDTAGIAGVAVFAEHFPTEFERDQHYLKDSSGGDVEPLGGDGHDHGDHDGHDHGEFVSSANEAAGDGLPWGPVIGASILVNLATLSGVVVVAMAFVQRGLLRSRGEDASGVEMGRGMVFDICIPAFAVGALISTAVFLIFPEALHLIEGAHADHGEEGGGSHDGHDHRFLQEDSHDGHDHGEGGDSEGANAAKFGCAIIGGFLIPMVLAIFFPHVDVDDDAGHDSHQGDAETGVVVTASARDLTEDNVEEAQEEEQATKPEESRKKEQATTPVINKHLCSSILLGDGFHNFGDGIFIGAAFKSCSTGTALSITFATLFHEIAQELADFVVLTRYAGLSVVMACVLNFLSGLTVLLGGVVFLAANPSDEATGVVLAMAGGVYFYIAGCETIPRIEKSVTGRADRVWTLVSVIVGTIPIGLILLNHEHC